MSVFPNSGYSGCGVISSSYLHGWLPGRIHCSWNPAHRPHQSQSFPPPGDSILRGCRFSSLRIFTSRTPNTETASCPSIT
ncbi:hypothetical protein H206_05507 [Candidatus Electrothrix aarhusensis]|uniref:Uncharacterized protein n=1 Tax=Candidatus Electrothrix aarhusensis TaxID=1859131 RepID=A0A444J497_9BACT|nr:hypothetical protein H206_05507 [Candidatus Electrothrix aarhusensis]